MENKLTLAENHVRIPKLGPFNDESGGKNNDIRFVTIIYLRSFTMQYNLFSCKAKYQLGFDIPLIGAAIGAPPVCSTSP